MHVRLEFRVFGQPAPPAKAHVCNFGKNKTIADVKERVRSDGVLDNTRVYRVLDRSGNVLDDDKALKDCGLLPGIDGIIALRLILELLPTQLTIPSWAADMLDKARELRPKPGSEQERKLVISDVTSDEWDGKVQWVNLVMQGGGVLGIAHVGFVAALEEAGVRFMGLGGTSAGAINAALIAAVRSDLREKSWLDSYQLLGSCPLSKFEDGPGFFKRLRKSRGRGNTVMDLLKLLANRRQLAGAWRRQGVHPGAEFYKWLNNIMNIYAAPNKAGIAQKLQLSPETHIYGQTQVGSELKRVELNPEPSLKLVTAELRTQTMVILPRDAELFYQNPEAAPVADFVRASMSVPLFFEPFKLPVGGGNLPGAGKSSSAWQKQNGFEGDVPNTAVFCDGGVLSNFPMAQFHDAQLIRSDGHKFMMPTIGAQLGHDRNKTQEINDPVMLLRAMSNTSAHLLDRDFMHNHPEYKHLVASIDTSRFKWLDFDLSDQAKQDLLMEGMKVGLEFLEAWSVRTLDSAAPPKIVLADLPNIPDFMAIPVQQGAAGLGWVTDQQRLHEAGLENVQLDDLAEAVEGGQVLDLSDPGDRDMCLAHLVTKMIDGVPIHQYALDLFGGKWQVFKARVVGM